MKIGLYGLILINFLVLTLEMKFKLKVTVDWYNLIWFPFAIHSHAFIGWVAMHNKLPTKARLL